MSPSLTHSQKIRGSVLDPGVCHLPIVKHYAKKIRLVETIDAMVQNQMQVSAGMTMLAMALDTLSGRSPLYRLQSFFKDKATELLLGEALEPASFADHNVSRVLDSLYDAGTGRIFSQTAQNAIGAFALDTCRRALRHHLTWHLLAQNPLTR